MDTSHTTWSRVIRLGLESFLYVRMVRFFPSGLENSHCWKRAIATRCWNWKFISNLPLISKVIEKVVFYQLNNFLTRTSRFEIFQSGFHAYHSTKTGHLSMCSTTLWKNHSAGVTGPLVIWYSWPQYLTWANGELGQTFLHSTGLSWVFLKATLCQ